MLVSGNSVNDIKDVKKIKLMNQLAEIKTLIVLATGKMKLLSQAVKSAPELMDEFDALIKKFVPEAQYLLLNKKDREEIDVKIETMLKAMLEYEAGGLTNKFQPYHGEFDFNSRRN